MKTVRVSLTMDMAVHVEMLGYCAGIDRTVQNFLVHAARQYMRRYPLTGQQREKRAGVVPEDAKGAGGAVQLQDCGPDGR